MIIGELYIQFDIDSPDFNTDGRVNLNLVAAKVHEIGLRIMDGNTEGTITNNTGKCIGHFNLYREA